MTRSAKTPLVILLLVGLIFASYWQVFAIQKAGATSPPAPGSIIVSNSFYTDATKTQIRFNVSTGPGVQPHLIVATKDTSITNSTKFYNYRGTLFFEETQEMPASFSAFSLDELTFSADGSKGYIFVKDDQVIKSGISLTRIPTGVISSGNGVALIKNAADTAHVSLLANNNVTMDHLTNKGLVTLTFMANGRAGIIAVLLSATNQEAACRAVNSDWEALKEDVRSLSIPKPGSVSGQSANANWEVTTSVTFAGLAAGFKDIVSAVGATAKTWIAGQAGLNVDAEATVHAIEQQTLVPTTTGEDRLRDVVQRAKLMDDNLVNLIANDANCGQWVKFKKFKWDKTAESDTNIYTSLTDLKTDIAALVAVARQYFDFFQEPVTTAGVLPGGACGSLTMNNMFQYLFCKLGELMHALSASIMKQGVEWLNNSIGLETGQLKFEAPKTDVATIPSNAPAATTTPGGLNISGTMKINDQTKYNQLKNASERWAKINQAGTPGTTITAAATFSNWNNSAKTVSVTFTTTDVVPSGWSNIRIYGGTGSGVTGNTTNYDVSTPYPITGLFNLTSQ